MREEVTLFRGISKARTVRLLGTVLFSFGIFWIILCVILSRADGFAEETVGMAAARYESVTGKIALNSFEEDKRLMQKVLCRERDALAYAFGIGADFGSLGSGIFSWRGLLAFFFPCAWLRFL